jgi:hypothetical protein
MTLQNTQTSTLRNAHQPESLASYATHYPNSQPSVEMNFFSLPLELRVMIYENVLQEEHHIFRDGVPGLLGTRLQITQEVYTLCKITVTVKSEVAPLYMNDLDVIKKRVDKFNTHEGNKGIAVRLLCRPELPSDFVTSLERVMLSKMNISATRKLSGGEGKPACDQYLKTVLGCLQMLPAIPLDQKEAFRYRFQFVLALTTKKVPDCLKLAVAKITEGRQ